VSRLTTAGVLAAQGAAATLTGPVNRPQLQDGGRVPPAPLAGRSGGGPLAGPATGRQAGALAAVELPGRLDHAAPRTTLDRDHAATPQASRLVRSLRIKGLLPLVPGPGALARRRGRFAHGYKKRAARTR